MKLGKGEHWWSFAMILVLAGCATADYNVMAMALCIILLTNTWVQIASDDLIDIQRIMINSQHRYIKHLEDGYGRQG